MPASTVAPMTEQEFRRFYDETAAPLHAYLARAGGDASVADDVLQSAYLRFLEAPGRSADVRARRAYLFRIATNLLRDRHRREAGLARRARQAAVEPGRAGPGPDRVVEREGVSIEARLEVRNVLDELGARERELLWLAYVVGMDHREIAAIVGVASGSVKVLLLRARRRMAAKLEARGVGPEDLA